MGELERGQLIQRISRLKTAIALGQPDRVPVAPFFDGVMNRLTGGSYKDNFYNHESAGQSAIAFLKKYPNVDAASLPQFTSGLANELGSTKMIDWPGRPGFGGSTGAAGRMPSAPCWCVCRITSNRTLRERTSSGTFRRTNR